MMEYSTPQGITVSCAEIGDIYDQLFKSLTESLTGVQEFTVECNAWQQGVIRAWDLVGQFHFLDRVITTNSMKMFDDTLCELITSAVVVQTFNGMYEGHPFAPASNVMMDGKLFVEYGSLPNYIIEKLLDYYVNYTEAKAMLLEWKNKNQRYFESGETGEMQV